MNTSFSELLATPVKGKRVTNRKKSLNYKATVLSKSLFLEDTVAPAPAKSDGKGCSKGNKKKGKAKAKKVKPQGHDITEWKCPVCDEEQFSDMRMCDRCQTWYHEDCVGLTSDDDDFLCPDCDD